MVGALHQEERGRVLGRVRIRHVCRTRFCNTCGSSPPAPDTFSNMLIRFPRMNRKAYCPPTLEPRGRGLIPDNRKYRGLLECAVVNSQLICLVVESMGHYHREIMEIRDLLLTV